MSINKTDYSIKDILFRAKNLTNSTSDAQLSKFLGVNPTTLSSWKSRSIIPYEYMYALSKTYDISFDWLMTGKDQNTQLAVNEEKTHYGFNELRQLDLYKNEAQEQGKSESSRNGYNMSTLFFPKEWFSTRHLNQQSLVAVNVVGDSLGPDIPNGSLVLVDTTQKELKNGEVYVFDIDGDLLIKTIIHDFDGYIARSRNDAYPDIRLNKERISKLNIVGRAIRALPDIKL